MRRSFARLAAPSFKHDGPPIISIANGTFYRHHPSSAPAKANSAIKGDGTVNSNPPLFPGLNFSLPSFSSPVQKWGILGKSSASRTAFLQILRGQHICLPPTARTYPYLATDEIAQKDLKLRTAQNAIRYVGFDAERGQSGSGGGMKGVYLSARYESRKEETDFSLLDFLMGNTELNPDENLTRHPDQELLHRVMVDLNLQELARMPVTHLSNGQTRRARIAKALLSRPEVLLLDGAFMGLDPPTLLYLSELLEGLAEAQSPRLILSLKPDEHIPDWITHLAFVTQNFNLEKAGPREDVIQYIHHRWDEIGNRVLPSGDNAPARNEQLEIAEVSRLVWENGRAVRSQWSTRKENTAYARECRLDREEEAQNTAIVSRDGFSLRSKSPTAGDPVVEMNGVKVQYGDKTVLGNWKQSVDGEEKDGLWWSIRRGQRWGVFGANGSGKTTLISLITSDHPQTYSLPVKLFGRSRLPEPGQPGISIFDLQKRIGHSSPEVHVFFPKHLSLRRTIESAWADTPQTKPKLDHESDEKVSAALLWFRQELVPSLGQTRWMEAEVNRYSSPKYSIAPKDPDEEGEPDVEAFEMNSRTLKAAAEAIHQDQEDMEIGGWADSIKFGELTFSAQRVALFLRAVIRNPDLVVLDEAFSGMDDAARDKCMAFLSWGEEAISHIRSSTKLGTPKLGESDIKRLGMVKVKGLQDHQALVVISHKREEVPGCVRDWIRLPESGQGPPRFGHLMGPLELGVTGWWDIWGEGVGKSHSLEMTLKMRLEQKLRRMEAMKDPRWQEETPEQRKVRLDRIAKTNAYLTTLDDNLLPVKKGTHRRLRQELTKQEILEKRRLVERLIWTIYTPEERARFLMRKRLIRWKKEAAMTPEERAKALEKRRKNMIDYLESLSPEQKKKRQEGMKFRARAKSAIETEEDRKSRNAHRAALRLARLAVETPEQREARKKNRREQLRNLDQEKRAKYLEQRRHDQARYRAKLKLQRQKAKEAALGNGLNQQERE